MDILTKIHLIGRKDHLKLPGKKKFSLVTRQVLKVNSDSFLMSDLEIFLTSE